VRTTLLDAVLAYRFGCKARVEHVDRHNFDLVMLGKLDSIIDDAVVVETEIISEPKNETSGVVLIEHRVVFKSGHYITDYLWMIEKFIFRFFFLI